MALVKRLAPTLRGSITFDNGGEFARHALLRDMLSATTYFCDAYASWQKGGVENTNGRISDGCQGPLTSTSSAIKTFRRSQ